MIIDHDIIGVSPMVAPRFLSMRVSMHPGHYRNFLRLNDRRRSQSMHAINLAGYPSITMRFGTYWAKRILWCHDNFGPHGYINHFSTIWFRDDEDFTLFKMTWL